MDDRIERFSPQVLDEVLTKRRLGMQSGLASDDASIH